MGGHEKPYMENEICSDRTKQIMNTKAIAKLSVGFFESSIVKSEFCFGV